MMLDVNIMDFIWENYSDDAQTASDLAGWKDDHINSIIVRMNHLLAATKNKVIHETFDIVSFQAADSALEDERVKALTNIGLER
jgi:hypothetical protein